jgi:pimeloyl-ACP methyl ester carboxylesterase
MPAVQANGITLEYESYGSARRETIVLIMGLGCQLTRWPMALCDTLVERGYRVIRFDNRDVGLSTKMDHTGTPNIAALAMQFMTGQRLPAHYALDDMALDVLGLLDSLNIPKAHIVGASMGGMIAQIVAAKHAARVYSLTSIMSTTGNPVLPQARPMARSTAACSCGAVLEARATPPTRPPCAPACSATHGARFIRLGPRARCWPLPPGVTGVPCAEPSPPPLWCCTAQTIR